MENQERVGETETLFLRISFLLLFPLLSLLTSCGIETYPYLQPPESSTIKEPLYGVEEVYRFGNNPSNNANYLKGYELYYKFYTEERDNTDLESDRDTIADNPTKEKLESVQYRRIYVRDDVTEKPLVPVAEDNKKKDFYMYIDFSLMGGDDKPYPVITYNNNKIEFCRYITVDNSDEPKTVGFLESDFDSDKTYNDFNYSLVDSDTGSFSVALYVVTYGTYDLIYDIYSEPAYLGRIKLVAAH
jgi:hypothetical protein